jgi:Tfp pilus assembly protein PilV
MASMRTLATQAAYDITDRMRANPGSAVSGIGVAGDQYVIDVAGAPAATDPIALADLTEWRDRVEKNLPGGASEITQCDTADGCDGLTHIITVYWDEARTGATKTDNCPPVNDDDLRCFRLVYSE